jgi:hypothetical protein
MGKRGVPRDQRLECVEIAGAGPGQRVGLGALGVPLGIVQWATSAW